jgi:hypothetical protein
MSQDDDAPDQIVTPLRRATDRSQAEFRRRVAYYSLLVLTLVAGALLERDEDIGPNASEIMIWIVGALCLAIVVSISAKAAEAWASIMATRGTPR